MNAPPQTEATTDNTSGFLEVYYGRTSDGLFAALVGENAFAMIPAYNGEHNLGHGWKLALPISEWKQSSFYGHGGQLDGKAAFRARVEENAEHQRQLRRLARRSIPVRQATPWGFRIMPRTMPRASSAIRPRATAGSISTQTAMPTLIPF
ncbi:hypothetical protein [Pelagibacterium luteolum]|uniref:Uncharacterized protein n=1 Tax=Pelagibacterium luteolum TaxID=440168 RepID=A0A1G8AQ17_9HYPH|nr:hypothetical protein [Pelagibacterium luteolum]SDH22954.1 hypothetical protein SAMN04487974_1367 [Pelagibacterium luteolum]